MQGGTGAVAPGVLRALGEVLRGRERGPGVGEVHRAVAAGHARRAAVRVPTGLEIGDGQQNALRHVVVGRRGGERLLQPVRGGIRGGGGRGRAEQGQQQGGGGERDGGPP